MNPPYETEPTYVTEADALRSQRPVGEIVGELLSNSEKLVRQEMQLGLAEIDQRVDRLKTDLAMATVGGAVLYGGVLVLLAALVLLLALAIPAWASALIVGGIVTIAGAVAVNRGAKDAKQIEPPRLTAQSIKTSTHTVQEAVHDARHRH